MDGRQITALIRAQRAIAIIALALAGMWLFNCLIQSGQFRWSFRYGPGWSRLFTGWGFVVIAYLGALLAARAWFGAPLLPRWLRGQRS